MLAAVYHGPDDLRLEERPPLKIQPDEALLKVISAGICGTDLRILKGGHRQYPAGTVRVPGHEVVGDIVEVGSEVTGLQVGARVMVAPNFATGMCRYAIRGNNNLCPDFGAIGVTIDGAFAEYMRIPGEIIRQGNLIPIDKDTDPAAAALIEPFACVLRGQKPLHITPSDVVLVMGAGPIGVMHVMLARLKGAQRIIVSEIQPARLPAATAAGADRVVDSPKEDLRDAVMEESGGLGADVIIVAAPSHQAQEEALQLAAIGGRINYFGGLPKDRPTIQFDSNAVHYKELIVTGTTACSTDDCWSAAEIVNAGRIDLGSVIGRRFPLSQVAEAFQVAQESTSLKIILEP
jgi:L-iditol 2-dehydrogenase